MLSNLCEAPHTGNARLETRSDSQVRASASSGWAVRPLPAVDSFHPRPTASPPGILRPRLPPPAPAPPERGGPQRAAPGQVGGAGPEGVWPEALKRPGRRGGLRGRGSRRSAHPSAECSHAVTMSLAAAAGRGPGAVWSPTHVQVTVLQARGLRAKGPGGTSDAYAVIQVGKEKYATSVSERSLGAPVWREEATFELPPLLSAGAAPAAAATLQLTVLHRALLGLDKFLGRVEVDLRELHRDQGRRKTQ